MLARDRAVGRNKFLSSLAASLLCACSGGNYSFESAPEPSTGAAMMADVGTGGSNPDLPDPSVNDLPVKDGATANTVAVDADAERVRDGAPPDTQPPGVTPPEAGFSLSLSGLQLWLSADVGLSEVSGHIAGWRDRSGNGNDAKQLDEGHRPKASSWIGGRTALLFDGASFLQLPPNFNDYSGGLSWFVVGDTTDNSRCPSFVHFSNGGEVDDLSLLCAGANLFTYEVADEYQDSIVNGAPVNRPLLLEVIHNATEDVRLFSSGVTSGRGHMKLPAMVSRSMNDIGRSSYKDCGLLSGHVAEIILYKRPLEDAERTAIEQYLRVKWGL